MPVSQYFGKAEVFKAGALTLSGANTLSWAPGQRVHVTRVALITTTAVTVSDATVSVRVRDFDDSPSTTIGSFVVPFTGSAIGDYTIAKVAARQTGPTTAIDGSIVYEGGDGPIEVEQTEELALVVTGTSTAGVVDVYVEYVPFGPDEEKSGTKTATFTAA